jgi:hypothetical protein
MSTEFDDSTPSGSDSPLETFLRTYADVSGGLWDEVEPQVYDLMLPPRPDLKAEVEVVRVTFDPEALAEHPGSQLASFGTPLVDQLLADAVARGRHVRLFFVGLNVVPQGLAGSISRALTLPEGTKFKIERVRTMHFPQAVFWFEATFVSDQKEQDLLSVAIDLHYGRQVRHLERLLEWTHLAEEPWEPLPEVRHSGLAKAYPLARERVVRTLAALANTRARELTERLGRQVERMQRYYNDLRAEITEQADRAQSRGDDVAKFASRREALDREQQLRIAELRQKNTLKVQLRLNSLLEVRQPKLLVKASVGSIPLELVWDPLTEGLEAVPCPSCGQPTFVLNLNRHGELGCPMCPEKGPVTRKSTRR